MKEVEPNKTFFDIDVIGAAANAKKGGLIKSCYEFSTMLKCSEHFVLIFQVSVQHST